MTTKKKTDAKDEKKTPDDSQEKAQKEPKKAAETPPEPVKKAPKKEAPKVEASEPKVETATEAPKPDGPSQAEMMAEKAKKAGAVAGKATGETFKKIKATIQSADANIKRIDAILNWVRKTFPISILDSMSEWATKYGHSALVAAQFVTALFFIIAGFKTPDGATWLGNMLHQLAMGFGCVVVLGVVQYTADKFLNAGKALIESSPSQLRSSDFLDCTAVLAEVGGIAFFIVMIIQAAQVVGADASGWPFFWLGLGVLVLCDAFAWVALNPSTINVNISDNVRAGEEAIGILSFIVKSVIKVVPILFGVGTILGMAGMVLFGLWPVLARGETEPGLAAFAVIAVSACLPFAGYVVFILYHLTIDIIRAILVLPTKLDEQGKR